MITFTEDLTTTTAADLRGFFRGWPHPPTARRHLEILQAASHAVLPKDANEVVGFLTVLSDGTFAANIPLLEVLPSHQGQGIGTRLVQRVLELTSDLYMVDVVCDAEVAPFYARLGLRPLTAMAHRNFDALRNA